MIEARRMAAMALTAGLLAGCALDRGDGPQVTRSLEGAGLVSALDKAPANDLAAPFVRAALEALEDGDHIAAQAGFNRALKFDPTNSQLHYLNGLTYHLRAATGDGSQNEYAAIGYRLALQYDSGNYWAAYQLGHLNFDDQRYREAQDAFAYALLFAPKEPALLKALAAASYYAQDLATASAAIAKAEEAVEDDPMVMRLGALIRAAGGDKATADGYLRRYRRLQPEGSLRHADYLQRRLGDWGRFHDRGGIQLAQSTSDILGGDATTTGLPAPDNSYNDDSGDSADATTKKTPPKMTMVDVVIIRSEERKATDKGVNLLSGLTLTLPTGTNTFNLGSTRTVNDPDTSSGIDTLVNIFSWNVPLQVSASYSLNIFNDNTDNNEILARPSLVALDGKKSEFFTGAVFHVQMDGVAGSEGTVTDVPVGIKLDLTPKFLSDNQVELSVEAARAFIEGRSSQVGFTNFAQITKTLVTANVVMKFDETLIISGLSEKETEKLHDGVPILQDIPGLQYLFSHEDTLEFTKSVLILVTPRKPRYTHADGSPKRDRVAPDDKASKQPSLKELKDRPGWFRPSDNLDAVFGHLNNFKFFREFRSGDVAMEKWNDPSSLGDRIKRAIGFLYY